MEAKQSDRCLIISSNMKQIETILKNHGYNYSRIYQRHSKGMIRVQFDFRTNLEDLDGKMRGTLLATRLLLRNYNIRALIEVTLANGDARILFSSDYERMKEKGNLII